MPDKEKEKKKEKAKGKVPGQGKTADAALNVYWSDDRRFAEVFGKEVFNGEPLDPKQLSDASNVESTMIKIKDGPAFTLKQTRDVVKSLKDGTLLTIVGIENQTEIDYSMPFRVKELDFINAARQVYDIKAGNHAERDPDDPLTFGETISNYYKDDRIAPVFTLVIYYGKEEWTFPLSMADMYIDSPYKKFVERGAMHLLDVRHMDDEKLDGYSDELKAFLGYLRCANAAQQREFVRDNAELYENLDAVTFDTLRVLTESKVLERMAGDKFKTPEGGINVDNGYDELEFIDFVNALQGCGFTKEDTVEQFVMSFNVDEETAKAKVDEYWKQDKASDARGVAWFSDVRRFVTTAQRFGHTKEDTTENLAMDFKLSEEEAKEMVEKYWNPDADASPGEGGLAFNA